MLNHGHETKDHRIGKRVLAAFWSARGYLCLWEEGNCDVVALQLREHKRRVIANEYERSSRNAIKNARRDLSRGADAVLIVVADEQLRHRIRRKLRRELARSEWTRVAVVLFPSLLINQQS